MSPQFFSLEGEKWAGIATAIITAGDAGEQGGNVTSRLHISLRATVCIHIPASDPVRCRYMNINLLALHEPIWWSHNQQNYRIHQKWMVQIGTVLLLKARRGQYEEKCRRGLLSLCKMSLLLSNRSIDESEVVMWFRQDDFAAVLLFSPSSPRSTRGCLRDT